MCEHREWGGVIFKRSDGTFSYSIPVAAPWDEPAHAPVAIHGICFNSGQPLYPYGTTLAANYHTHPFIPKYDPWHFSWGDQLNDEIDNIYGYVVTPTGNVLKDYPTNHDRNMAFVFAALRKFHGRQCSCQK
jgi:hypothetical protein